MEKSMIDLAAAEIAKFKEISKKEPKNIDNWIDYARFCWKNKLIQNVEPILINALQYNPRDPDLTWDLLHFYYMQRNYVKTIETAKKQMDLEPNDVETLTLQGYAYFYLHQYSEAETVFLKLIDIVEHPEWGRNLSERTARTKLSKQIPRLLGRIYSEIDDIEKSLQYYNTALDNTTSRYWDKKTKNRWKDKFNLTEDPIDAFIYWDIGNLYYQQREYRKAIENFSEATKILDMDSDSFTCIGRSYYKLGENETALKFLEQGVEISPESLNSLINLGVVLDLTGQEERSKEILETAISLNPDNSATFNNIGYCYYEFEKLDMGEKYARKSVEMDESNDFAWDTLACILEGQGKLTEAKECLKKALKINPANPIILKNLDRIKGK